MSTADETRPAARLTVLAGPSGAGRASVVEAVRARFPATWTPVPATTRPRRGHEVHGVDRIFLDPAGFARLVAEGRLIEWSRVGPYLRGTPHRPVRARLVAGRPVLLPLDPDGALRVREVEPDARLVLLVPPGFRPDARTAAAFELTLRHDLLERVAGELVGLLGSSFPAPVQPRPRG
ncbi:guanylate kinase [Micromonospora sp. NBRC 101691]|uniref:guanylate kinase n=1 Tax=Micromonospora TaxID=1873 RepID=UPI0024A465B3|nr:guanylate kinase [Micromonospora sp. NBRC 101691]GLY26590.1 guanylate kinase [Micromonospora sp. NBRC 101691]